ncbi:MAG TPA: thiolase family protein [Planctomycetota bacterium]|nr:thiolase family protein [Planctomycetota bacterium]
MSRDALILDALRTPVGKNEGGLRAWRADDLAAETMSALARRNGVDPGGIDDVVLGCVTQTSEQGVNIARNAALAAGFPVTVPGTSVNRLCASGLQACAVAAQAVQSGQMDLVIGGGTESMSRVPMGSDAGAFSNRILDRFDLVPQGISAEFIAEKWQISRRELDEFSYASHQKALRAPFKDEILPIGALAIDEGPRKETSVEKMGTLKAAFKEGGLITAGNSSQISDGAAALLIASPEKARALGRQPRARFVATAAAGVDPTIMLTGPIPATQKVLQRAGLSLKDIDLFECNEAFAPVVLAWIRETGADPARVNVNGGAIALGHPLGCTGARLLTTILHELERRGGRYGLVTLCIGMGQGMATIIERMK